MSRKVLVPLIFVLVFCICLVVGLTGAFVLQNTSQIISLGASPTAIRVPVSPSAVAIVPSPIAPLPATPMPSVSTGTADALLRMQIPGRDLYQIVPRLRKNSALLTPIPTPAPRARNVGDRDTLFVVEDQATGKYRSVPVTLQAVVPHAYFWVEDGLTFDRTALQKSADFFESNVFPTNTKYFGTIPPGPDGDARIHVFSGRLDEHTGGYFSTEDTYPRAFFPFSNQRNIIYMNITGSTRLNSDNYNGDLAHEFQHLIHSYQSTAKTGWIDEGMGDLAIKVNGFPLGGVLDLFARNSNTQLNTWATDPQDTLPHYAASYLFFNYAAGRFSPEFTREVIHAPREGVNGVQAVLDKRNPPLRFDDLFADWAVTNYLNDPSIENGRYAYTNESGFRIARIPTLSRYPLTQSVQMNEYATSYFTLQPANTDVTVYFTGTTTTKLLAENAHGGQWMWYSNRADLANMTLTRQFDLSRVSKATLQFWTWFRIEHSYDYAYIEASTDGGKTWDVLPGKHTTNADPNGAAFGPAYTGRSGVSDTSTPAQWVQEQIDLSAYAGKTILLRFEYITDDAVNLPGWAIDDIAIPEINYSDSIESGDGGWQAAGFVRVDNVLPQRYVVQVVEQGKTTQVVRVQLDAQNRGNLKIDGFGTDISKAVLIVTAYAPTTTEPTEYQFGVAPK